MKRFGKILTLLLLGLVMVAMSACSFFAEEEIREIENIYYVQATEDEVDGIMIVIEYVGDDYPDSVFFVANGEEGKEGNGITDVTAELVDGDSKVRITVNYTDKTRDPSVFTFDNGIFPTEFTTDLNEETGDWDVSITLSNGDVRTFSLHNGVDGDTVLSMTSEKDEESGTTWLVITMASIDEETGENRVYRIPMPDGAKGDKGVGIDNIQVDDTQTARDPYNIHLRIYLTDGRVIEEDIPKVNNWSIVTSEPTSAEGNLGDFRFNKDRYIIYYKNPSTAQWEIIMDLSDKQTAKHSVTFIVEAGITIPPAAEITHGYYFSGSEYDLPVVTKPGYKFLGWWTCPCDSVTGEPTDPSGVQFTDLTPVLYDLTLYARFVPDTTSD